MARNRSRAPESSPVPQEIGPDGWPVRDPERAAREEKAYSDGREREFQRRLRLCEEAVLKDRYGPALMDALRLCLDRKRPLPEWLGREVWATMVTVALKPRNRRAFEASTARRRKHYNRWAAVESFRDGRRELAELADALGG